MGKIIAHLNAASGSAPLPPTRGPPDGSADLFGS